MSFFIKFAMIKYMKKDIHPKYYPKAQIRCACGAVFEIGSTKQEMETEICSACHPFYTGKEKIIETGQVEKFKKRMAKRKPAFVKTTARQEK